MTHACIKICDVKSAMYCKREGKMVNFELGCLNVWDKLCHNYATLKDPSQP